MQLLRVERRNGKKKKTDNTDHTKKDDTSRRYTPLLDSEDISDTRREILNDKLSNGAFYKHLDVDHSSTSSPHRMTKTAIIVSYSDDSEHTNSTTRSKSELRADSEATTCENETEGVPSHDHEEVDNSSLKGIEVVGGVDIEKFPETDGYIRVL